MYFLHIYDAESILLKLSLMPLLLVQLLGTTDFMLVMPLGPSLAEGFNIPVENTAWLSGVFAICAAISGFVFAKHLDKFERKKLLCILLLVSAALFFISSQLQHFESWLVLRGLIGFLSTPIAALSMAIAIDLSEEHRTQAMAQMSLGFSLAAIFGVPAGLFLANFSSWQTVYSVQAGIALFLSCFCWWQLPTVKKMKPSSSTIQALTLNHIWHSPHLRHGFILLAVSLFAAFLIIPHLAAILQFNFNVAFSELGMFYAVGGMFTMVLTLLTAKLHQRISAKILLMISSVLSILILWSGFVFYWLAPLVIFVGFMSLNGSRNVIIQTHLSHLPEPHQRAGFMALLTTFRNIITALAAFLSSQILISHHQAPLENIPFLISLGSVFILLTPLLLPNTQPTLQHVEKTA